MEKLEELYANRSSGSYTKKLINIKGDYNNYNFIPDNDVTEQFYKIKKRSELINYYQKELEI